MKKDLWIEDMKRLDKKNKFVLSKNTSENNKLAYVVNKDEKISYMKKEDVFMLSNIVMCGHCEKWDAIKSPIKLEVLKRKIDKFKKRHEKCWEEGVKSI